jgi:hypothetical protein
MAYGEYTYQKMKNYPKELDEMGITPVFFPRQDGLLEHYALLDKDEEKIFSSFDLSDLVTEADKMIKDNKKS